MSWEWLNDDRMIIVLLKYSFKLFSKSILTDTLPSGRFSLPLSSFQIILENLVCLSEVRKINTNLWDDKHHDPKTIFSPLHYRHCYSTTLLHATAEPFQSIRQWTLFDRVNEMNNSVLLLKLYETVWKLPNSRVTRWGRIMKLSDL